MRTEPPVSVPERAQAQVGADARRPIRRSSRPAPGRVSHGLRHAPKCGLFGRARRRRTRAAAPCRRRWRPRRAGAARPRRPRPGRGRGRSRDPRVPGAPATSMLSFTAMGRPASGPGYSPAGAARVDVAPRRPGLLGGDGDVGVELAALARDRARAASVSSLGRHAPARALRLVDERAKGTSHAPLLPDGCAGARRSTMAPSVDVLAHHGAARRPRRRARWRP